MFGTKQETTQAAWPDGVVTRYLNVGGATVDLHEHSFITRYDSRGHWVDTRHEVDGFNCRCLGCDWVGRAYPDSEIGYQKESLKAAHSDAQEHAEKCRAMPRPA